MRWSRLTGSGCQNALAHDGYSLSTSARPFQRQPRASHPGLPKWKGKARRWWITFTQGSSIAIGETAAKPQTKSHSVKVAAYVPWRRRGSSRLAGRGPYSSKSTPNLPSVQSNIAISPPLSELFSAPRIPPRPSGRARSPLLAGGFFLGRTARDAMVFTHRHQNRPRCFRYFHGISYRTKYRRFSPTFPICYSLFRGFRGFRYFSPPLSPGRRVPSVKVGKGVYGA